ncbi:MAG: 4'-phosphopantetheinyl transferase superfamily protein [Bacteroidales bacterium]|nr:4'-phosphopantetheinyl transferase superfamily protein [Bacteroidales bacterium]
MPLINTKIVNNDLYIGFWKITEDSSVLFDMLFPYLDETEVEQFQCLTHERRKCEWLASRILIFNLLGKYQRVYYNQYGKPFIEEDYNISITHSYDMAGVLLSRRKTVGLDVEKMNLRILKVENKLLEQTELNELKDDNKIQSLYVNWCAKEAMYKACGIREIDIKSNFRLEYFDYKDQGEVYGFITKGDYRRKILIHYSTFEEYMIAWCAE